MRLNYALCRWLTIFLFTTAFTAPVSADGDVVAFSPIPGPRDSSGCDATISFWELPMWIQIDFIMSMAAAYLAASKLLVPFIAGKLKRLLDNETRDQVYRSIRDNPGSTPSDIVRREGLNLGTVRYHIRQLQLTQKITALRLPKFVRLFQNSNTYSDREKRVIAALKREHSRALILYLAGNPGATNREIAARLTMTESGAHRYIKELLQAGIMSSRREGSYVKYYLEDDVGRIIRRAENPDPANA